MSWKQSEEAMRNTIAREIWAYQEADKCYGDFDAVDISDGMAHLIKTTCIDQAERIRKAVLTSAVFKAAFSRG